MTVADFLASILADPDDDTPRLQYADWLMERGDPRGEFIRVQCEIARIEGSESIRDAAEVVFPGDRLQNLHAREHELLALRDEWILPTPFTTQAEWDLFDALVDGCGFRRGFAESVTCTARDWIEHAAAIRAQHPVRDVTLSEVVAGLEWTRIADACRGLRKLYVTDLFHDRTQWIAFHAQSLPEVEIVLRYAEPQWVPIGDPRPRPQHVRDTGSLRDSLPRR